MFNAEYFTLGKWLGNGYPGCSRYSGGTLPMRTSSRYVLYPAHMEFISFILFISRCFVEQRVILYDLSKFSICMCDHIRYIPCVERTRSVSVFHRPSCQVYQFFVEFPQHGLATQLKLNCDSTPDKRFLLADYWIRCSSWSFTLTPKKFNQPIPLLQEMLDYVRSDTHYFIFLYGNPRNALLDLSDSCSLPRFLSTSNQDGSKRRPVSRQSTDHML